NQDIQEDTLQSIDNIMKMTKNIEQEAEAIGNWTRSANQDIQEKCCKDTSFQECNQTSDKQQNDVGCPEGEGYFRSKVGNQCFKAFIVSLNWDDAQAHCEKHGMRLARPQDPVWLNTYLNQIYGDKQYYLGARGSGSVFTWRPSGD
ncbi:unnamed protein product, partial [Meganyctiphanes norvegica]